MNTMAKGAKGAEVRALQHLLNGARGAKLTADGIYGNKTWTAVCEYQAGVGIEVSGIADTATLNALCGGAPTISTSKGKARLDYIKACQALLNQSEDGVFGSKTKKAVVAYQAAAGLTADGIVGAKTWAAFTGATAAAPVVVTDGKPIDYKQYDTRWANRMYSASGSAKQTIKSSGCGPTSMADIVATWFDSAVTPVEMCELALKGGYRTANSGTAWGFFPYVAAKYGFAKLVKTSSIETLKAALDAGALAVCNMGKGYWTNGGHYICAYKQDGKYIYANDPASSKRTKQAISDFGKQGKMYFIFYRGENA